MTRNEQPQSGTDTPQRNEETPIVLKQPATPDTTVMTTTLHSRSNRIGTTVVSHSNHSPTGHILTHHHTHIDVKRRPAMLTRFDGEINGQ